MDYSGSRVKCGYLEYFLYKLKQEYLFPPSIKIAECLDTLKRLWWKSSSAIFYSNSIGW